MSPNTSHNERRQLQRFPAAELLVRFHTSPLALGRGEKAEAEDFTRTGLSLITRRPLKEGERLRLTLRLRLDHGEIVQRGVVAIVRNQKPQQDGYRYGLLFDFQANHRMRALKTQARLGRMEGILDRMAQLASRHQSGEELLQGYGKK
ncbi:MAG: PilZ domain-containing protein [Oleiphilaceae bacterium]|nr:PilZ domain-containing protein [Oleiphilaceae bacterium]